MPAWGQNRSALMGRMDGLMFGRWSKNARMAGSRCMHKLGIVSRVAEGLHSGRWFCREHLHEGIFITGYCAAPPCCMKL